ncbi:hypothetical protein KY495_23185 [Massilia sp. PAMC28688]|uniref:hypothetical protein n=1 Tax=Massilia sp. PAMC28688 TaxID=2861283 RepID=UPI001C6318A8|nr:hypothetical protein [Massilia sp. PAMC28688]QYF93524.1 hypothetical protein KY495_23185 [Massilia sp. PAMC28688]
MQLVELGDLGLTLPTAIAMTALLAAWRAWRMAWCWSLLFALGFGTVAFSKIVFMGWGGGWQALCFKALSGHATGVTAVYPTLLYLLLQGGGASLRHGAVVAGLGLGALVAVQLAVSGEHSMAEAVAGWLMGAVVSLLVIALSGPLPPPRPLPGMLAFGAVFALFAWLMQWAHVGYWMAKLARLLSGQQQLFPL